MSETRRLRDLASIGPAMERDLVVLGIHSVQALVGRDAHTLWLELCARTGHRHDPCVEDSFAAAIAQAENPDLPAEQCNWWYWTTVRKARKASE